MSVILLSTLNARYHHASFGLRYLYANLGGDLKSQAKIREFTISQNARDIAEAVLAENPKLVGFGVYIWNTKQTEEVISILKRVRPDLTVVIGGPEVSFEGEGQGICALADHVIQGEADFLFRDFCRDFLNGKTRTKWIKGPLPEIKQIELPYALYSDEDIRNRVLYVEASRGCPYKCEYCLSSLDKSVRNFDLDRFLAEMERLIERGARQFKFVDRTFNLSIATSSRILEFFLTRIELGLFLHFEMVPDRLPGELRELIKRFPRGALQFEVGIQTWSPVVAALVSRRQDYQKIRENLRFLTEETGVHIHADLIAGLPGETRESFAQGFDELAALGPHEIQVGLLKRLKGTPIVRHDQEWAMTYQEAQPFQILSTKTQAFLELQKLGRFSHFWDLIANSGNFGETIKLLKVRAALRADQSFFEEFFELSEFFATRHSEGHGIALLNLLESVWIYFTEKLACDRDEVRSALVFDYTNRVKRDIPRFLRGEKNTCMTSKINNLRPDFDRNIAVPKRQARHLPPASL